MQSGDYDGGSFSGDATSRLMAGGTVAPVNTALIPNYANIFEGLKNQTHNSLDGVPYGVPHGRGPNLLMYNTDVRHRRRRPRWDAVWNGGADGDGKVSIYDSSIYIADAALHLMATQAGSRHHQPVPAQRRPVRRGHRPARPSSAMPGPCTGAPTPTRWPRTPPGDVTTGTSWQFQVNLCRAKTSPSPGRSRTRARPAGPTRG